jgi:uracil-DNA glycosylase
MAWDDASGDRLREWLQLDKASFYDEKWLAMTPMGFCYPGANKGGDNPPRSECAPKWHELLRAQMPNIQLTILVGGYAHKYYLKDRCKKNMGETVFAFEEYLPDFFPLPHPSWHNTAWLKKNPDFEMICLTKLRSLIRNLK